jgi:hypothetical protein
MQHKIHDINSTPLEDIELYRNNEKIEIDPEMIEEWKFIGLSNMYFIFDEYYLGKPIHPDH